MSLVQLNAVEKVYRRGGLFGQGTPLAALQDIHLEIPENGCLGLIGRSGSGKSTLGRLLLGLERPTAGTVSFRNRDLRDFTTPDWRRFRRQVQAVFQNALGSVNPRFTAGEVVAEPLRHFERLERSALRRRVGDLLEAVGLSAADAGKFPHQFSGGQLQRVCIARALAPNPCLIVLDEAVSSLDMLVQARILELLRSLRRQHGMAYLFISHDIRIVAGFCDQVCVLHEGRLTSRVSDLEQAHHCSDPTLRRLAQAVLPPLPAALAS